MGSRRPIRPVTLLLAATAVLIIAQPGKPGTVLAAGGPPSKSMLERISQSYVISGTISFSAARVNATEVVTLTNGSGNSFDQLQFGFAPRFLARNIAGDGFAASVGTVKVDENAAAFAWPRSALMLLDLGRTVDPGEKVMVEIPFSVKVGRITHAAFAPWRSRLEKNDGVALFGNWFPIVTTNHAMGNIGDPFITWTADSIDLDLTLADAQHATLSQAAVAAGGNRTAVSHTHWAFRATNVRDLAFAISPSFVTCRATMTNAAATVLRAYAKSSSVCAQFVDAGSKAFAKLSDTWGAYPYGTLTIIQAPRSGYSMEYPTSVSIGARHPAGPIWHELAHQWFYGLLGDDQVREPWLDEAWAEFSEHYLRGNSVPTACSRENVDQPIGAFSAWSGCGEYPDIIYRRGSRFVDALRRSFASDASFFGAVRAYIADHRYGMISMRDLLDYLDGQTSTDLFGGPVCVYTSYC